MNGNVDIKWIARDKSVFRIFSQHHRYDWKRKRINPYDLDCIESIETIGTIWYS